MATRTLKKLGRLIARLLGVAVLVGAVVGLGWMGWRWQSDTTVKRITVTGVQHAPADTLRQLARVDTGVTMGTLAPRLIADRVARHPWVETVDVRTKPFSHTLELAVTERVPAALAVSPSGRPAYYLDAAGYAMPLVDGAAYDVPLVHGVTEDFHPTHRVASSALQETLDALSRFEGTDVLVSGVVVKGDGVVQLLTEPIGVHSSLPVRVRRGEMSAQLQQLQAFAQQVLATRPNAPIGEIDLRFDGQIVTRKQPADG